MSPQTNGHVAPPTPNDAALGLLATGRIEEALSILLDQAWQDQNLARLASNPLA